MQINENVYGAQSDWINSEWLASGQMKCKCANFGNNQSTLAAGNAAGKTPHNAMIDRSISFTALGNESLYSRLVYVDGSNTYIDDVLATEYFFAECNEMSSGRNIDNNSSSIDTSTPYNAWKTYATGTGYDNYSDLSKPIVEINPRKILYILYLGICSTVDGGGYESISMVEYVGNAAKQAAKPYIFSAWLSPRVDNSNTSTPSRSALSNPNAFFGICINREFNDNIDPDIRLYYTYFRSQLYNQIPIYGVINNYFAFYDNRYIGILLCEPDDLQIDTYYGQAYAYKQWSDETREFLIRQAACFGVYFRADISGGSAASIPLNHNSVYLGLLDEQGIGHGEYTRGADNENNPIYNWSSYSESPYDYTKPVDPTPYNDRTVFGDNTLSNTFIQYYAMSKTGLESLCTYIYNYINSVDTTVEDINKAISKTFYTNNPLDTIVSLKMFPFSITDLVGGTPQNIKLGHLSTGGAGTKLNGNYTVVDLGSYECFPKFGNCFLDYSPYTYYELIIPFCGSTRLDPSQFMGKTLRLKMAIDLYTGACTCYILANNLCIDSLSGNCAIDMAVTGIQSADFQNSMQNAITNVKNARINQKAWEMRGGLAMGAIWRGNTHAILGSNKFSAVGNILADLGGSLNPLTLGSNLVNSQQTEAQNNIAVNKAEYDLQHMTTPFSAVGSQSAANSRMEELQARLIIYRPEIAPDFDPQIYADTYGFATLENDTLSKYSGLTVAKINLAGVRCSDEERQMIENLFANGVYL